MPPPLEVLNALPLVPTSSLEPEDRICWMCWEPYYDITASPPVVGEAAFRLPCGHVFGYRCLREWLVTYGGTTCGTCRSVIAGLGDDDDDDDDGDSDGDDDDDDGGDDGDGDDDMDEGQDGGEGEQDEDEEEEQEEGDEDEDDRQTIDLDEMQRAQLAEVRAAILSVAASHGRGETPGSPVRVGSTSPMPRSPAEDSTDELRSPSPYYDSSGEENAQSRNDRAVPTEGVSNSEILGEEDSDEEMVDYSDESELASEEEEEEEEEENMENGEEGDEMDEDDEESGTDPFAASALKQSSGSKSGQGMTTPLPRRRRSASLFVTDKELLGEEDDEGDD